VSTKQKEKNKQTNSSAATNPRKLYGIWWVIEDEELLLLMMMMRSRVRSPNLFLLVFWRAGKARQGPAQIESKKVDLIFFFFFCDLFFKDDFKRGSKVRGPMNSNNLIGQKL